MATAEANEQVGSDSLSSTGDSRRERYRFQPGLPALLSVVVPGLGQCYSGRWFAGFLWFITTLVGYVPFVLPGIVLHILAVATACFQPDSSAKNAARRQPG